MNSADEAPHRSGICRRSRRRSRSLHGRRTGREASEIKYVVNNTAITSYDIQKRAAFLKLQRKPGASAKMAADQMVEQVLKSQEMEPRKINISKADGRCVVRQVRGVEQDVGQAAFRRPRPGRRDRRPLQGIHPRPDGLGPAASRRATAPKAAA